jgi:hypothetical protein
MSATLSIRVGYNVLMRAFGLIGLLITVALAVWWLTSSGPVATTTVVNEKGETVQESSYKSAIDSAKGAVDLMESQ